MLTLSQPARIAGGIFDRLDAEWAVLCADTAVQAVVTDWLMADHLADDVAAVTDSWVRNLGPVQLLATLRPRDGVVTDELTDAVLRALLHRAAGRDRSATLAARIIVQAMIPGAVRMTRGQVRPFGGRTFDDIGHMSVAALYVVARSGRIHTRPGRPAANLALDALRRVCRELAADREVLGEDLALAEDLADTEPGPAESTHVWSVRTAAAAAGLTPAGPASEAEASRARLELLELVLDAMEAGTLSPADGRAIAWHYTTAPVPDTEAASRSGATAGAWQRRRSRAVDRLKSSLQLRPAA
ncbi:hypothetical protein OG883_41625 [Streptomyces sp. NBC_01142]|uniref:hypothetical protein n=1 Tax=Streptomyces sp. NBC_01142 TaxID=2975865 RepID=UPI00224F561E|nr:hypothetical protein [Streptomyces sp. NBC_01142]MCX4826172.1 hypothetical protein [Streptomyces sp. NBC_01142]